MKNNIPAGITAEMLAMLTGEKGDAVTAAVGVTCRGYCEYYGGEEGEESCGGFSAVQRGLASGKITAVELSYLMDVPPALPRRSGCLINEMCLRCGYLEGGCDYMSTSPPPDATPCGGYRLLQALLDCGALTPDRVRTFVQNAGHRTQDTEEKT